jgi:hypothetical protein
MSTVRQQEGVPSQPRRPPDASGGRGPLSLASAPHQPTPTHTTPRTSGSSQHVATMLASAGMMASRFTSWVPCEMRWHSTQQWQPHVCVCVCVCVCECVCVCVCVCVLGGGGRG